MASSEQKSGFGLITGASSGIGAAFAERLAADGVNLILVARRQDRLEALAKKLHDQHHVQMDVLHADLSKRASLQEVEKRIASTPALDYLINNAGFAAYMPFVELDPDKAEEQLDLHVVALTRLTRAALPGMIARKHGAIINVSSRLAFSAPLGSAQLPKRATYAASKAYINTFTQLLHSELEGTGVQAQALCPGVVETEFHSLVGADMSRMPAGIVMSAEDVVRASLAALELGEAICIPSMEDVALLEAVDDSQRKFFEETRAGKLASRYVAP